MAIKVQLWQEHKTYTTLTSYLNISLMININLLCSHQTPFSRKMKVNIHENKTNNKNLHGNIHKTLCNSSVHQLKRYNNFERISLNINT